MIQFIFSLQDIVDSSMVCEVFLSNNTDVFVSVRIDGKGMGGDGTEKEGGETEGMHCGCWGIETSGNGSILGERRKILRMKVDL